MADRAEIRVTVDTRQAQAEVRRTDEVVRRAEERRVQLAERADRVVRRIRRGAEREERPGGIRAAGAFAVGVLGARVGLPRAPRPTTGPGGLARAGAGLVGRVAAGAIGVSGTVADVGQFSIEVLRPVVESITAEFFPRFFADVIRDAITEDANAAVERLRQVARLDAITARVARRKFLPIAGAFAFAGDAFTADEISDLSNQFSRASLRQSFLERQEARRSTTGFSKAFIEGVSEALGD